VSSRAAVAAILLTAGAVQAQSVATEGGYLPLTAGAGAPLLGALYIDNAAWSPAICIEDASGAACDFSVEASAFALTVTADSNGGARSVQLANPMRLGAINEIELGQVAFTLAFMATPADGVLTIESDAATGGSVLRVPSVANALAVGNLNDDDTNAEVWIQDIAWAPALRLLEYAAPAAPAAKADTGTLFTRDDNRLYYADGAGTEHAVHLTGADQGELVLTDGSTATTLAAATWAVADSTGWTLWSSAGMTASGPCLVAATDGTYSVTLAMSVAAAGAATARHGICVDDGAGDACATGYVDGGVVKGLQTQCIIQRYYADTSVAAVPVSCRVTLDATDMACVALYTSDGTDVTVSNANLRMEVE